MVRFLIAVASVLMCSIASAQCPNCGGRSSGRYAEVAAYAPAPVQIRTAVVVASPPPAAVVRTAGPTWTWPGNLSSHLQSSHGASVAGLSHAQQVALHDSLHNAGRTSRAVVRSRTTYRRGWFFR